MKRRKNRCCGCLEGCLDTHLWWSTVTAPCREVAALTALLMPLTLFTDRHPDPSAPAPRGRAARFLYSAVVRYRREISPTTPPRCPYTPTCSTYAVQALHRYGALRGGRLSVVRLLRCTPGQARRRGGRYPLA
ncbi:membrane protein insertion efficiency factor YidD [Streptomyces cinnabarinus]|uniref:Membrane protein insertion efficiency factor YidD n=1 Tax=Streptomyces cinnabarinus TaxID=67287 RepID=A0ABY7KD65_9ACTN|nr:membrane protein insertion efficiency factor YidD [Streptomyces cinnabarinus]WAZ22469.1 membrane protein insertion efficiency factor YidD [Streptomyces cinnabarinus]